MSEREDARTGQGESPEPNDEEPKIIPFPRDDRWLICGCRKCEARREEAKRVG